MDISSNKHYVAVVGAGPAGLYAAKELADNGVHVTLFNRDIKPGGLAEYGIYPDKYKMKSGLRRQFSQILDTESIDYFGNVTVGNDGDVTLDELRQMGFDAILVTVGAQGTKWLGLEGENLRGVYHAKDLVYHYNHLPPFSQEKFDIGRRVAIIGVGNVMLDIAHWAIRDLKVDEVVAVARRGPAEVKFTKKEMEIVGANLDLAALDAELARCKPVMDGVAQDAQAARDYIVAGLARALEPVSETKLRFDFLASPYRILGEDGRVTGLEVEETTLLPRGDDTKAKGLGTYRVIPVDTVVFAIGDRVDEGFGLPVAWNEFVKRENPRFPVDGNSYEVFDPATNQAIDDVFVAGWARKASEGLVGAARKDGTNGAKAVLQYLATKEAAAASPLPGVVARVQSLDGQVVRKVDVRKLEAVEARIAAERHLPEFKFDSNEEMLAAIK
ncbi:MAG: FAD-dependent oxidoreductase [Anaerolineales bacterium]|nr:FAD-dependent oxidoreductase [Anaerolineales bacterium]MCB8952281.1 FAD-dependent oxidoreductase [Ardenticatenales bacterium]